MRNHAFIMALCEAVGVNPAETQEMRIRVRPGGLVEVTAEIMVIDGGKLETIVREYRFEAIPREVACQK